MQMMIKDPVKDPRTAERKVAAEPEEANVSMLKFIHLTLSLLVSEHVYFICIQNMPGPEVK